MRAQSKLRRMVTRRRFLGALAGLTAVTALAGAGIRLPKRTEVEVDDQLIGNAWYLKTDKLPFSNTLSTPAELSEKVLKDMLNQLRDNEAFTLRPTKLIVPPRLRETAVRVLNHEPTLGERLWWWLSNSEYRNA